MKTNIQQTDPGVSTVNQEQPTQNNTSQLDFTESSLRSGQINPISSAISISKTVKTKIGRYDSLDSWIKLNTKKKAKPKKNADIKDSDEGRKERKEEKKGGKNNNEVKGDALQVNVELWTDADESKCHQSGVTEDRKTGSNCNNKGDCVDIDNKTVSGCDQEGGKEKTINTNTTNNSANNIDRQLSSINEDWNTEGKVNKFHRADKESDDYRKMVFKNIFGLVYEEQGDVSPVKHKEINKGVISWPVGTEVKEGWVWQENNNRSSCNNNNNNSGGGGGGGTGKIQTEKDNKSISNQSLSTGMYRVWNNSKSWNQSYTYNISHQQSRAITQTQQGANATLKQQQNTCTESSSSLSSSSSSRIIHPVENGCSPSRIAKHSHHINPSSLNPQVQSSQNNSSFKRQNTQRVNPIQPDQDIPIKSNSVLDSNCKPVSPASTTPINPFTITAATNINPKLPSEPRSESIANRSTRDTRDSSILPNPTPISQPTTNKSDYFISSLDIPNEVSNNTFTEAFFIASFSKSNGSIIENSDSYLSSCGHPICSSLPAMQPEIWYRFPEHDTKDLELNNLCASICFPSGIKLCHDEKEPTSTKNYTSIITNQQGDRFYLVTYHFYYKVHTSELMKAYKLYPIKYQTIKFCDDFYEKISDDDDTWTDQIQEKLDLYSELNFHDIVYIPHCWCLVSRYPYFKQIEKCLEAIRITISSYSTKENEVNDWINFIVKQIPIPPMHTQLEFTVQNMANIIEIRHPMHKDILLLNTNIHSIVKHLSVENILIIYRLWLFEQRIWFVDSVYNNLTEVTNAFISIWYPFQWMHTYIPIMSNQMLKYLQSYWPFVNGLHKSWLPWALDVLQENDEDVYIVYILENQVDVIPGKNSVSQKCDMLKRMNRTIPEVPRTIHEEWSSEWKKIKTVFNNNQYKLGFDMREIDNSLKIVFMNGHMEWFHDYCNYLTVLDKSPIFNITAFLKPRHRGDHAFYKEFVDSQWFQWFLQNSIDDNKTGTYFEMRAKEYNRWKGQKEGKRSNLLLYGEDDYRRFISDSNQISATYGIRPYFIQWKTEPKSLRELNAKWREIYPKQIETINRDGVMIESKRIWGSIDIPKHTANKQETYKWYYVPNSDVNLNVEETKQNKVQELRNKERDDKRENVKDILSRAFRSEISNWEDDKHEMICNISNWYGREFLIESWVQNITSSKVISRSCYELLLHSIKNALLFILKSDNYLDAVLLFKAAKLYYTIENGRSVYLSDKLYPSFNNYSFILKNQFWNTWIDYDYRGSSTESAEEWDDSYVRYWEDLMYVMISLRIRKDSWCGIWIEQARIRIHRKDKYEKFAQKIKMIWWQVKY